MPRVSLPVHATVRQRVDAHEDVHADELFISYVLLVVHLYRCSELAE
jgi:hypothetical protein